MSDNMEMSTEVNENKPKKKSGKSKKKIILIVVIVVVVLIVGIAVIGSVLSSISSGMQDAMEMISGENETIYEVKRENLEQEITTSGTVIGIEKNAYTSPVTAKVDDICVEVGQTVKEGDILLTYDASELGDNLEMVQLQAKSERAAGNESYEAVNEAASKTSAAKKEIKELESDIKSLEKEMKSLTKTITKYEEKMGVAGADVSDAGTTATDNSAATEQNAVSALAEAVAGDSSGLTKEEMKEYNKAVKDLEKKNENLLSKQEELAKQEAIVEANKDVKLSESTKTQISVANQISDRNVSDAQESVEDAEAGITAKEDGIVESVDVIKGSYASESQTLMTIINGDSIGVEFTISKDDLGSVAEGQKARLVIGNNEYEGTVDFISRVASAGNVMTETSASTGSITGRIVIDNPDDEIFIGVSAKVYIFVGAAEGALAIPYEALCTDIDGDYVYVVNEENLIERKDVTVGLYSGEYYEVLEGIAEGDKVIREVTKDMKPGDEYIDPMVAGMGAE